MVNIEIRVGSDSDIPKIKEILKYLDDNAIEYHGGILSAHRTPNEMLRAARDLEEKGYKVSIAGAGGSAHLAGMTASETAIPVIAVPVISSAMKGLDSLLSMMNMPPGVPNGCVPIYGEECAARMAYQILTLGDDASAVKDEVYIQPNDYHIDFSLLERLGIRTTDSPHGNIGIFFDDIDKSTRPYEAIEEAHVPLVIPMSDKPVCIEDGTIQKISRINMDALYMPLNVAKPNMTNAFLYSAQILGLRNPGIRDAFMDYRKELADQVREKNKRAAELFS